jgi:hypothetical protein
MLGATAKVHRYHILQRGPPMELVGIVLKSLRCNGEVEPFEGGEAIRARDSVDGLIICIEPTHGAGSSRAHDGRVRALFGHSDQESEICHQSFLTTECIAGRNSKRRNPECPRHQYRQSFVHRRGVGPTRPLDRERRQRDVVGVRASRYLH